MRDEEKSRDQLVQEIWELRRKLEAFETAPLDGHTGEAQDQAEDILHASERRFLAHFQNNPVPIFAWKHHGDDFVLSEWNQAANEIAEGAMDSIAGISARELYCPEQDFMVENLERCFSTRQPIHSEFIYSMKTTGQEKWIKGTWIFVEPDTVMVHTEDITEHKRVEDALRISENRFRDLFEHSPLPIFVHKLGRPILTVNRAACKKLGYSRDELVGKKISDIDASAGEPSPHVEEWFNSCSDKSLSFESRHRHKDGSIIHSLVTLIRFYYDGEPAIMSSLVDITDRKQLEQGLLESKKRLQDAQRIGGIGDWEWDPHTDTVTWSPNLYDILGLDPELPVPCYDDIMSLYHPDDRDMHRQAVEQALKGGKDFEVEVRRTRPDGSTVVIQAKGTAETDEDGTVSRLYGTVLDITDRKRMEAALTERVKELEGLYALGRLAEEESDIERWLDRFVNEVVPPSMQFPDHVLALAEVDGITHANSSSHPSSFLSAPILADGVDRGRLVVGYDSELEFIPDYEQRLVDAYAERLGHIVERLETHQTLEKTQTILNEAEKLAGLGGWEWSLARNTLHVSENWLAIHGFDNPTLTMEELLPIAHPEDQAAIEKAWGRAVENGEDYDVEHRIIRQDTGEVRHVKAMGKPVFNESGKVVKMYGAGLDITERKANETALKRIEWLLSRKPGQDMSAYTPPYGDVTALNTCRTIFDSVGPQLLSVLAGQTLELLETSVALYEKNGDYAYGLFTSGWCQFMDLASRNLCGDVDNREALACGKWLCHENCWNSSARAAMASGQATDIECVGGIHLYGVPIMVEGKAIGAINIGYGDPPSDEETLGKLSARFNVSIDDLRRRAEEYESRPAYIVDLAKQNLHGIARLIGEIVSRREMEKQLQEARIAAEAASRSKSEFLANMSHEIRTPLNGVMGMLQLLNASGLDAELSEYANIALESSRNLLNIINDILDFSKIEAGKIELHHEPFEIDSLLRSLVFTFSTQIRNKETALDYRVSPDTPNSVVGDLSRLRQVLFNLVGNAIKFTDKGRVRIEVRVLEKATPHHLRLGFSITDTGIGIAQDMIDYLFEPFTQVDGSHTRKFKGTGLGLSIVKRLINLMGGAVAIDSTPGQGTSVRFDILVVALESEDVDNYLKESGCIEHASTSFEHSLSILVAEDDHINATLIKKILTKLGHNVILVHDGSEILEALLSNDIDLVLMDIQMPGIDGVEATSIIRNHTDYADKSSVPIIALTAHALKGDQEHFLEAGMDGYVAKPVEMKELQREICRVLEKGGQN